MITRLAAAGTVRLDVLDEATATEPHRLARARWSEVQTRSWSALSSSAAGAWRISSAPKVVAHYRVIWETA